MAAAELHILWLESPLKPARMGRASGYIMRAFAKAPQISSPSATTTRSSLFETRSLRHWTSHRSGSRPLSARPTRCFSAAHSTCSSWSMDSLPLSGDSLAIRWREPFIKEHVWSCSRGLRWALHRHTEVVPRTCPSAPALQPLRVAPKWRRLSSQQKTCRERLIQPPIPSPTSHTRLDATLQSVRDPGPRLCWTNASGVFLIYGTGREEG